MLFVCVRTGLNAPVVDVSNIFKLSSWRAECPLLELLVGSWGTVVVGVVAANGWVEMIVDNGGVLVGARSLYEVV